MQRTTLAFGAVIGLVLLAGCAGVLDGDGGGDGSSGPDWCAQSTIEAATNEQAPGDGSVEIHGMVDRDDRRVCELSYEASSQQQYEEIRAFFNENVTYYQVVFYDSNGTVIDEMDMSERV